MPTFVIQFIVVAVIGTILLVYLIFIEKSARVRWWMATCLLWMVSASLWAYQYGNLLGGTK